MNFRQLEAFKAVMASGSGVAAAKMLFITQPAISRLISDLEYNTGLQLFIRKPNRLEPTPEAQALYSDVERAFIGLDEIKIAAQTIANQRQGSIRIVAMPVCVESFLPTIIAEYSQAYPQVSIEIEIATRATALKMLRARRFDIGVVSMSGQASNDLDINLLCQQEAVCALPVGHELRHKPNIQAKDLQSEPFISLSRGSPFRGLIDNIFVQEKIDRTLLIETRMQKTIYELVKKGVGISILDPFVTNSSDEDIVLKPFLPEIVWDYVAIQLKSVPASLNAKSFMEMLKAHFS